MHSFQLYQLVLTVKRKLGRFGNGVLLPPQTKSLDEYFGSFTDSQRQILAAIIGAAGCGKSYVMGAIVTYLKTCDLVVTKLAPSGVAASLILFIIFLNW